MPITRAEAVGLAIKRQEAIRDNAGLAAQYARLRQGGRTAIATLGIVPAAEETPALHLVGYALLLSGNQDVPAALLSAGEEVQQHFSEDGPALKLHPRETWHHRGFNLDSTTNRDFADLEASAPDKLVFRPGDVFCPSQYGIEHFPAGEGPLPNLALPPLSRALEIAEEIVGRSAPFELALRGGFVSPAAFCLSGYDDGALNRLRTRAMGAFQAAGIPTTENNPNIVHFSLFRFRRTPEDLPGFLRRVAEVEDAPLGRFTVSHLSLVFQWRFFMEGVRVIKTVPLAG